MERATHIERLYEAIEALPEGVTGEIIDGQLYAQPRPSAPHAFVAGNLGADLLNPFGRGRGGPGGWWILGEPELHLRRNAEILVPDIGGWRRKRMPALPDDQRFEVVADWVCEILSPSTASRDREVKLPVYARYGVAYAWLVDPRTRTVEAFALDNGHWQPIATFGPGEGICAPPFEAVTLDAETLWK